MKTSLLKLTASLFTALLLCTGAVKAQEFAVLLNEDFEGGTLPAGWSQDQAVGSDGWQFNIASHSGWWEIPVHPDGGVFTASNDDLCNCDMSNDLLFSPVIDLTPYDSATLIFDYFYDGEFGSIAQLWFSYDGGANWLFVPLDASTDGNWVLNIGLVLENGADLLNNGNQWFFTDQMIFAFRHNDAGTWADGVAVDNVALIGFADPCENILPVSCAAPTTLNLQGAGTLDWQHASFCDGFAVNGFQQLYTFTPDVTDEFTLTVSDVTSLNGFPWFQYYVKEVSAGCDIEGWNCIGSFGAPGSATFDLQEGVEYYILVASEIADLVSQTFEITCPAAVPGCNNPAALNFDAAANQNDGSCVVPTCGDAPLNVTHCYAVNTTDQFLYEGTGSGDLPTIMINSGTTEAGWDFLTIYDGDNTNAPVLYTGSGDHSGVSVQSTSGNLLIVIESDGTVSCASGSACCTAGLDWDIYCGVETIIGCTDPTALNYDPLATVDDGSCTFPVANDLCADAIEISCGDVVNSTTVGANSTDAPAFCGTSLNSAPGVWYHFAGNGDFVTASLCGSAFDTKIGVFSGDCGALTCVGGNDDFCGSSSQSQFTTTAGVDYYIYVTGFGAATGAFTLSLTCEEPPTPLCESAIAIACGDVVTGTTVGAESDLSAGTCTTGLTSAPGVYYVVQGTGLDITASLCGSSFDTKLGVFSGDCGSLVCVEGNDDFCGTQSEVTFTSVEGESYYLYVTGFGTATGAYTLSIECDFLDCNGDLNGTAFLDNCNVCVGGNTGIDACTQDCNGDWGGIAFEDNCSQCVGGNTGIDACTQDCNGDWGGTAFEDNCNVCVGGNTGLDACLLDCNGVDGGTAFLDNCNVCVGGNTGIDACTQDCNGDWGGTAFEDNCSQCVGGNTGIDACTQDCNGDWGGTAFEDNCNVCVGGNTGLDACPIDCNGEDGGTAFIDNCGDCVGGSTGLDACVQDCNGDWGGTAFIDECGDCVGGNTSNDPCEPVGVAESLDRSLSVYPNPNNGQFIVELNGAEGVGTLNIMDMMGRRVYTTGVNFNGSFRQSIDLNVAKGTYVLQVITENGIATRKVELH